RLIHREPVILTRDEHAAGIQVLHWMVRAVVAELHFHRARAAREPEYLVAETNAEDRQVALEQLAGGADRVLAGLRIARTIRQEYAIRRERLHFLRARLRRHDGHAAAEIGEQPQDIALDAEIVGHDVQPLVRADGRAAALRPHAALVPLEAALARDNLREIHALQPRELASGFHGRSLIDLLAGHDAAGLRALLAQHARELARIDAGDGDDAAALEKLGERLVGAPVARQDRQVADDEARGIDLRGFEVFGCGARVADVRAGQCDDLTGVGRIGENFLVARQRGIET